MALFAHGRASLLSLNAVTKAFLGRSTIFRLVPSVALGTKPIRLASARANIGLSAAAFMYGLFGRNSLFSLVPAVSVLNGSGAVATVRFKEFSSALQSGVRIVEMDNTVLNVPATVNAGATVVSDLVASFDVPHLYCRALSSQNGTLILYRYSDIGGVYVESSSTATMTANQSCSIDVTAAGFSQRVRMSITNTGSAAAAITAPVVSLAL